MLPIADRQRLASAYEDAVASNDTEMLKRIVEYLGEVDPSLLGTVRRGAVDARAAERIANAREENLALMEQSKEGFLNPANRTGRLRDYIPTPEGIAQVANRSKGVRATLKAYDESPILGKGYNYALAFLTAATSDVDTTTAYESFKQERGGLAQDILSQLAGEAPIAPQIVLDSTAGQVAVELANFVPGIGHVTSAAFQSEMPLIGQIGQGLTRNLPLFLAGMGQARAIGAVPQAQLTQGGATAAEIAANANLLANAARIGTAGTSLGLTASAVEPIARQGTATDSTVGLASTRIGLGLGRAFAPTNVLSAAAIEVPNLGSDVIGFMAAEPEIANKVISGEGLTEAEKMIAQGYLVSSLTSSTVGLAAGTVQARANAAQIQMQRDAEGQVLRATDPLGDQGAEVMRFLAQEPEGQQLATELINDVAAAAQKRRDDPVFNVEMIVRGAMPTAIDAVEAALVQKRALLQDDTVELTPRERQQAIDRKTRFINDTELYVPDNAAVGQLWQRLRTAATDATSNPRELARALADYTNARIARGDEFIAGGASRNFDHLKTLGAEAWERIRPILTRQDATDIQNNLRRTNEQIDRVTPTMEMLEAMGVDTFGAMTAQVRALEAGRIARNGGDAATVRQMFMEAKTLAEQSYSGLRNVSPARLIEFTDSLQRGIRANADDGQIIPADVAMVLDPNRSLSNRLEEYKQGGSVYNAQRAEATATNRIVNLDRAAAEARLERENRVRIRDEGNKQARGLRARLRPMDRLLEENNIRIEELDQDVDLLIQQRLQSYEDASGVPVAARRENVRIAEDIRSSARAERRAARRAADKTEREYGRTRRELITARNTLDYWQRRGDQARISDAQQRVSSLEQRLSDADTKRTNAARALQESEELYSQSTRQVRDNSTAPLPTVASRQITAELMRDYRARLQRMEAQRNRLMGKLRPIEDNTRRSAAEMLARRRSKAEQGARLRLQRMEEQGEGIGQVNRQIENVTRRERRTGEARIFKSRGVGLAARQEIESRIAVLDARMDFVRTLLNSEQMEMRVLENIRRSQERYAERLTGRMENVRSRQVNTVQRGMGEQVEGRRAAVQLADLERELGTVRNEIVRIDERLAKLARARETAVRQQGLAQKATERAIFAANAMGEMGNVVKAMPDGMRGLTLRAIQEYSQSRKNLFGNDRMDFEEGRVDIGTELVNGTLRWRDNAYEGRRNREFFRLQSQGLTVRQAEARINAIEAEYLRGTITNSIRLNEGSMESMRMVDELKNTIARHSMNRMRWTVDPRHYDVDLNRRDIFQNYMEGALRTGSVFGGTASLAATFGNWFGNPAIMLERAARNGVTGARQMGSIFQQAANAYHEMRSMFELSMLRRIETVEGYAMRMTRAEKDFVDALDGRWMELLGSGDRAGLEAELSSRGIANPRETKLYRMADWWWNFRDRIQPYNERAGIGRQDNYFPHVLTGSMRYILSDIKHPEFDATVRALADAMLQRENNGTRATVDQVNARAAELKETIRLGLQGDNINPLSRESVIRQMLNVRSDPRNAQTNPNALNPQASVFQQRQFNFPDTIELNGRRIAVLERDPEFLARFYIDQAARFYSARAAFGSEMTPKGAPARLVAIVQAMKASGRDAGGVADMSVRLLRDFTHGPKDWTFFGEGSKGIGTMDTIMAQHLAGGFSKRNLLNATASLARANMLSGSQLINMLTPLTLFRDVGMVKVAASIPAALPFIGRPYLSFLLRNSYSGRAGALGALLRNSPDAPEAMRLVTRLVEGATKTVFDMTTQRVQQLAEAPEANSNNWLERGANVGASAILTITGFNWINEAMNRLTSATGVFMVDALHNAVRNGDAKAKADATYDLTRVLGIQDVARFTETGPRPQDYVAASRSLRARNNVTDVSSWERPFIMRYWAGRLAHSLGTYSLIQGANLAMELERKMLRSPEFTRELKETVASIRAGSNTSAATSRKLMGMFIGYAALGLTKEAVQTLYGQSQPTDNELANLALETATELGYPMNIPNDALYATRMGGSPTDSLVQSIVGSFPTISNAVDITTQLTGAMAQLATDPDNSTEWESRGEQVERLFPLLRRINALTSQDDTVDERFADRMDSIEESIDQLPMLELLEQMLVVAPSLPQGRRLQELQQLDEMNKLRSAE